MNQTHTIIIDDAGGHGGSRDGSCMPAGERIFCRMSSLGRWHAGLNPRYSYLTATLPAGDSKKYIRLIHAHFEGKNVALLRVPNPNFAQRLASPP